MVQNWLHGACSGWTARILYYYAGRVGRTHGVRGQTRRKLDLRHGKGHKATSLNCQPRFTALLRSSDVAHTVWKWPVQDGVGNGKSLKGCAVLVSRTIVARCALGRCTLARLRRGGRCSCRRLWLYLNSLAFCCSGQRLWLCPISSAFCWPCVRMAVSWSWRRSLLAHVRRTSLRRRLWSPGLTWLR